MVLLRQLPLREWGRMRPTQQVLPPPLLQLELQQMGQQPAPLLLLLPLMLLLLPPPPVLQPVLQLAGWQPKLPLVPVLTLPLAPHPALQRERCPLSQAELLGLLELLPALPPSLLPLLLQLPVGELGRPPPPPAPAA